MRGKFNQYGRSLLRTFWDALSPRKLYPSCGTETSSEELEDRKNVWIYRLILAFLLVIVIGILLLVMHGIFVYLHRQIF
ncbi:MAG: hypothetical protein ACFE96_01775 [Candidatus Hermodarchaeota archaeon]